MARPRPLIIRLSAAMLVVAAACTAPRGGAPSQLSDAERQELARQLNPHVKHPEPAAELDALEGWFYDQRMAPAAAPAVAGKARLAAAAQADQLAVEGAVWQSLGPRPLDSADERFNDPFGGTPGAGWGLVSGRVTSLATVPNTNGEVVYVGTADGGVWKTGNGGANWRPIGEELETQAIGSIAVDPVRPQHVYVGTGEPNTSSDSYWGAGVYRSTDGGETFEKVGGPLFDGKTVFKMLMGGRNSRRLFAATNRGLYRSADQGDTWELVLAPAGPEDRLGNFITDIAHLPPWDAIVAAVGWRAGSPTNGLYLSTDGGVTFTDITMEATAKGFPPRQNLGRMSLATSRREPGLVYAVVQDAQLMNATGGVPTALNGVYKSTMGPRGPWVQVANSQTYAQDEGSALNAAKIGPTYQPGIQSWYNQYVVIDPKAPDHVVVGLEEIYDTDDGGLTWDTIGRYWNFCLALDNPDRIPPEGVDPRPNCNVPGPDNPTVHPDQHAAAFAIMDDGRPKLYAGSDGGVWSQVGQVLDNNSWSNLNRTFSTIQAYYAIASQGPDPVIYTGTQDNGTGKYLGTQRWSEVFGGDGGDVAVDPDQPDHAYQEYVYLDMSKTDDGGKTWTNIAPPDAGDSSRSRFIAPFDLDPLDDQHLVALGRSVWESHAGIATTSATWQESYDNGPNHVGTALAVRGETIYEAWCGPCNPTPVTDPQGTGFQRGLASNIGGEWHPLAAEGLPNRYVTGIAMLPRDPRVVFVTLSGFSRRWVEYAGEGHVFISTDGGESFTDLSRNLPDIPANDVVLFQGRPIVATDVGIFRLGSGGKWRTLGHGMPPVSTLDLSLIPGTQKLMAATHGRGIWTLQL